MDKKTAKFRVRKLHRLPTGSRSELRAAKINPLRYRQLIAIKLSDAGAATPKRCGTANLDRCLLASDDADNDQQDYRADGGEENVVNDWILNDRIHSQGGKNNTTDQSANDSDDDIADQSEAVPGYDLASKPARDRADK
jgi:hypothetical protein